MSDYEDDYEDDFEDAELTTVGNKSSSRGYAPSTASSVTGAELLGDGIALGKKPAVARGKQSMASSFSSYASSSADPFLGQRAHELSSSSPSPTSSNGSSPARRQPQVSGKAEKPNGTAERHTGGGGSGRGAVAQQQQPASGGRASTLSPSVADGDNLNVVSAFTAGLAPARHDAHAELSDDEGGDRRRELKNAPKFQRSSQHSSAKSSPQRSYRVESSGAATTRSTTSSASPSPVRRGVTAKKSPQDNNRAIPGNRSSSSSSNRHNGNGTAKSSNSSRSRGGPVPGADRIAAVYAPEQPPQYTTSSHSSTAASRTSRTSSTANPTGGPSPHPTPNISNISGERHDSDTGVRGTSVSLHMSNYTRVDILEDDRDGVTTRRSAAEIDASARVVSDEEEDDAVGGVRGNGSVSRVAPSNGPVQSSRSEAYSDTFTNVTTMASAQQSHVSHLRSRSPSNLLSVAPTSPKSSDTSSSSSSDSGSSTKHSSGAQHNGAAVPLSLMPQQPSSTSATSGLATANKAAAPSTSVRGQGQRRQLNAAAADANLPAPTNEYASDTDDDELTPSLFCQTPEMQRKPPETPDYARRTPRSQNPSRSSVSFSDNVDTRSSARADSTATSAEREALLLRIAELRTEVAAWDSRIAKQRAAMQSAQAAAAAPTESQPRSAEAGAGRGRRPRPAGGRRGGSAERLPPARMNGGGGPAGKDSGRAPGAGRLAKLRAENKALEAKYARLGVEDGTGMSVQALILRADGQLQKARERLKEVTAARRALENRDKRAAHTIEEVHRRMPPADELQHRQINEGIYSRTSLLQTAKELRANLERTRASTKQREEKLAELTALVRRKHFTNLTTKEYEALCAEQARKAKAIERHAAAISIYTNAIAHDVRAKSSLVNASASACTSCASTPHKASSSNGQTSLGGPMHEEQVLADYESTKAAQLQQQQQTLLERKQKLEASIEELQRRVQQRSEQIKANHTSAGLSYAPGNPAPLPHVPSYVVGGSPSPAKPTPRTATVAVVESVEASHVPDVAEAVAGSGAVAARKNSLRDVLRNATRRQEPAPVASAPAGTGAATTNRLRGAVTAARTRKQKDADSDSDAVASRTSSGARSGRGSRGPTPAPQTTAAALARADKGKEASTRGGRSQQAPERGAKNVAMKLDFVEDDDADDVDDAAAKEDASIEAMLRKIDEDNRRLGEAVFGHEDGDVKAQERQQHQHQSSAGGRYGGLSSKQPAFLQGLDEDADAHVSHPVTTRGAPTSTGAAKMNGRHSRNDANSRDSDNVAGAAASSGDGRGIHDRFLDELDTASEVDDEVGSYVNDDGNDAAYAAKKGSDAVHQAGGAAGTSGRTTPEWLRDD